MLEPVERVGISDNKRLGSVYVQGNFSVMILRRKRVTGRAG